MRIFVSLLLVFLIATGVLADNLEKGKELAAERRYAEALTLLTPLAERGNGDAQYHLGGIYGSGIDGAPPDYDRAVYWLEKAVERKYRDAALMLGKMYLSGQGVRLDPQKGAQLILLADTFPAAEPPPEGCDD